ncbi:UDP-N-acetylmuramate dehydrogenase [Bacillus carboniphilus]|uniref:UDP-N-acetylenolpyruvoylglucosamine reductase n=1 Tax=Bacillus carboniphilus TaxID=86663 RepID=A0ABY9JZ59_9BACI|nr:UDP-N-acetylmuramate dehydrogenase [Bacillus carboniphilus]WLR43623.1 UDP-N-acetylmuramate dehydrogenase [Bacillus carboniphilus]
MKELLNELREANIGNLLVNEPMSQHTTMKIGGPADLFIEPVNVDSFPIMMKILHKYNIKWRVIGRGSNLLVDDLGIEGVVIKLSNGIDHLKLSEEGIVTVGGGFSIITLSTLLSRKGYSGLEFASGIPGSVGGAVYMNAGAHGSDISNILVKSQILFEDGSIEWLTNEEMEFSYRTSILQQKKPGICIQAVFQLEKGEVTKIKSDMQKNKDYRKETQPWNLPCAGSIFRNPLPYFAGQLIEKAGLKGLKMGGAMVSEMHANFIVNTGNATFKDVIDLIEYIKQVVKDKYNISMETEVEIVRRKS